jgi:hypothetical protein
MTATMSEDLAVGVRERRERERLSEVPFASEASPVAKAVSQLPREAPWFTTHQESSTRDEEEQTPSASANVQGEQVPLRLAAKAAELAASLRKESPPHVGAQRALGAARDAGSKAYRIEAKTRTGDAGHREAADAHRAAETAYQASAAAHQKVADDTDHYDSGQRMSASLTAGSNREAARTHGMHADRHDLAAGDGAARDENGRFAAKSADVAKADAWPEDLSAAARGRVTRRDAAIAAVEKSAASLYVHPKAEQNAREHAADAKAAGSKADRTGDPEDHAAAAEEHGLAAHWASENLDHDAAKGHRDEQARHANAAIDGHLKAGDKDSANRVGRDNEKALSGAGHARDDHGKFTSKAATDSGRTEKAGSKAESKRNVQAARAASGRATGAALHAMETANTGSHAEAANAYREAEGAHEDAAALHRANASDKNLSPKEREQAGKSADSHMSQLSRSARAAAAHENEGKGLDDKITIAREAGTFAMADQSKESLEAARAAHAAAAAHAEAGDASGTAPRVASYHRGMAANFERLRDEHGRFTAKAADLGPAARAHAAEPESTERGRVEAGLSKAQDHRVNKAGSSFSAIERALTQALRDRYPPDPAKRDGCGSSDTWPRDVYADNVVYVHDGKLWRLPYVFDGVAATLGATPELVQVQYVPAGT